MKKGNIIVFIIYYDRIDRNRRNYQVNIESVCYFFVTHVLAVVLSRFVVVAV